MIEALADMPPGTIGFRAGGRLTADDYRDVVLPALDAGIEAGGKLRVLVIVEALHAEPMALWEELKADIEFGVKHREAWERTAIVSGLGWVGTAMKVFGKVAPGEAKAFGEGELEDAKAWLAA